MNLVQKPDLDKTLERFDAWWDGEILDRPLLTIYLKWVNSAPMVSHHKSFGERWMDTEFTIRCVENNMKDQIYVAESFPIYMPNLGPPITATLFGAELEFSEKTSWSNHPLRSCRDVLKMKPNFDNVYWKNLRQLTQLSLERGKGKWITGMVDLHTNAALLSSLRGSQELCMELADDPDAVIEACRHVTDFFGEIYENFYELLAGADQPATSWIPYLHKGKAYITSCDFSALISTQMFERAVLPSIVREADYLDANIYHLDGPGALHHIDDLLDQPHINAIQWVYGAGKGPASDWINVYQKIQAAGKGMEIIAKNIADAKKVAENIKPKGVWFMVEQRVTQEEAQDFIGWLERWAAGKKV